MIVNADAKLKIPWEISREGSSPSVRTNKFKMITGYLKLGSKPRTSEFTENSGHPHHRDAKFVR